MSEEVVNDAPPVEATPETPPVAQETDVPKSEPTWRETLPDDLKTDKSLEKFKDVPSLAKSYLEAQKAVSKAMNEKGVKVPGENATPEEIAEYRKTLGIPETPDGYELESPALPEGMVFDQDKAKAFAELAHAKGISKEAFQELVKHFNASQIAEFEASQKAVQENIKAATIEMKKEWGKDFEKNLAKAEAAIITVFGEDFNKMLQETGLGNDPRVIRGMFKASQTIGEDRLVTANKPTTGGSYSMEGLISMKMDDRYLARDPLFLKQVAEYNENLNKVMGSKR